MARLSRATRIVFTAFVAAVLAVTNAPAVDDDLPGFTAPPARHALAARKERRSGGSRRESDHLRIVVAGDEASMCEALRDLLAALCPEARVIAAPNRIAPCPAADEAKATHLLVLDIALPARGAREVRKSASNGRLTFVAAYVRHEEGPWPGDSAVSSQDAPRLAAVLAKARARLCATGAPLEAIVSRLARPAAHNVHLHWISAARRGELELVPVEDVRFFRSDAKYTRVAIACRDVLIHKPIAELADELDPSVFWQVHRSTIVNVNAIARVRHASNGRMVLQLKDRPELIAVSQPYARLFHPM